MGIVTAQELPGVTESHGKEISYEVTLLVQDPGRRQQVSSEKDSPRAPIADGGEEFLVSVLVAVQI